MSDRSKHHRKCRSNGGKTTERNISDVAVPHHRAWHLLFGNRQPKDIADYINGVWIDPDYMFICVNRKDYMEGRYSW